MNQEYNLVTTRRNSKPKVFDTLAAICKVLNDFGAILSIGWQKIGSMLACRYVVVNRSPMLIVDIFHDDHDRLLISMSNGSFWQVGHDSIMPASAFDLAFEIRSATRGSKSVRFKQEAFKQKGANHD